MFFHLFPVMAYCDAPDMHEHLQCSVCLDVFNDPVTTPCGHNFCKTCLTACWVQSQDYRCPYCKGTFIQRPDLKFNVTLKAIVQLFEKNPEGIYVYNYIVPYLKYRAIFEQSMKQ